MKFAPTIFLLVATAFCAPTEDVADPPYTHNITFHVKHGAEKIGQITLGLFGTVVPKTVANFVQLSTGENGYGYENATFHRIIDNFMIQGGDIEHLDGRGGFSIYGKEFKDENFIIKHDRPGRLSMANAGPNTQGSQFFITTVPTSWLNGHHVVFGQAVEGLEFLDYLQKVKVDENSKPLEDVVITLTEVKQLNVNKNANADYFDDLRAQRSASGYFWLVVFGLLGVGVGFILKNRKKNLVALRTSIAFNSRDD